MSITSIPHSFFSKGKLLLSGEYAVLDGAIALAVPTILGQQLEVYEKENNPTTITWKSINSEGVIWFEAAFSLPECIVLETSDENISDSLVAIFKAIKKQNHSIFHSNLSYECISTLEFPTDYGLGSSSTLLYNMSLWSHTNPYELLKETFGGSAYDIACAQAESAIIYQWTHNQPQITPVFLSENVTEHLAFIHLNTKQNSREGIQQYKSLPKNEALIEQISEITYTLLESEDIDSFSKAMDEHEKLLSDFLQIPTVKQLHFRDYPASIKSLGAWGGDFILVVKTPNFHSYFQNKGFHTIFDYSELIYTHH